MSTLRPLWLAVTAALFLPITTAFYPYRHGDKPLDVPAHGVRTRHTWSHFYESITQPFHGLLSPRQNSYTIVNSNTPKQQKSVAIDQDGNDLIYMVAVTFGTSKKVYHLLLDSAASNTWVMGSACSSDVCKSHNTLGTGDSTSLQTGAQTFNVTYGTGSTSGTLATDILHLGSLSTSLTFGLATDVSKEFASYPMDGIMGIGRGVAGGNAVAAAGIIDALANAKLISSKLYAIHLSRAREGVQNGELDVGAVNKDWYSGELNWLSALDSSATGFWEVAVTDAGVDDKMAGLTGRTAILDTGTSYILMPLSDAQALHALIPGSAHDGETFSVPCSTTSIVQISFNRVLYDISVADWKGEKSAAGLCVSNIVGRQAFDSNQWLVGDVFLKNVFTVFDFDQTRVGMGAKANNTSTSSSSSASAGTSQTARASPSSTATTNTLATPRATSEGQQPKGRKSSADITGAKTCTCTWQASAVVLCTLFNLFL